MTVDIGAPLNQSPCDFISGGNEAGYCEANPDPTGWDNAPDTTVGADPAWQLEGDIAAIGANIAP